MALRIAAAHAARGHGLDRAVSIYQPESDRRPSLVREPTKARPFKPSKTVADLVSEEDTWLLRVRRFARERVIANPYVVLFSDCVWSHETHTFASTRDGARTCPLQSRHRARTHAPKQACTYMHTCTHTHTDTRPIRLYCILCVRACVCLSVCVSLCVFPHFDCDVLVAGGSTGS